MSSPLPTLIPYLTVRNAEKAIEFYEQAFGFALQSEVKNDEGSITHVEMSYKDILVMFAPEDAYGSSSQSPCTMNILSPMTLYVYCDHVDDLYAQAMNHGATSHMAPHDSFWGDRVCQVADQDGFLWMFAKNLEHSS